MKIESTHIKNDTFLIKKIIAGDTNTFQILIDEYKRLVSHIVFKMINKETEREDICQDIFIKVYQNLSNFKYKSKLSTWIARIAYNTCINYLEKKKLPFFNDLTPGEESTDNISGNNLNPHKYTEKQDISAHLHSEINQMPVNYRTILTLYHIDEMSYKEIGEILNLAEGTIKSHLFRARKLLKERLMSKYKQEELWH